jgi:hypothetical protein
VRNKRVSDGSSSHSRMVACEHVLVAKAIVYACLVGSGLALNGKRIVCCSRSTWQSQSQSQNQKVTLGKVGIVWRVERGKVDV